MSAYRSNHFLPKFAIAATALGSLPVWGAQITPVVIFDGTDGIRPRAGLTAGSSELLYGTTYINGSIFSFNPINDAFNSLNTNIGSATALTAANGDFYGVTGGTVFKFDPVSNQIITIATGLDNASPAPLPGLVFDNQNHLYGTVELGGSGRGEVIGVDVGLGSVSNLAPFTPSDGLYPTGEMIETGLGIFYGTTNEGGVNGEGTVYKFNSANNTLTTLASFSVSTGDLPIGNLVSDGMGNLYGTGYAGGDNGDGGIFKFDPTSNTISLVGSFNGTNGKNPQAGLIMDADGNLFGTAYGGGLSNLGTVFEYNATTKQLTSLGSFDGSNGANPQSTLIADSSGNLYGTAFSGGNSNDDGTVFDVTNSGFVIPEPSSLCIVMIGGLALFRRKHPQI
jgi:uncharacterized repeat protein (TIGR03803 family)